MQQRAQESRQKILNAGIEEFALHGFHGAKIDAIADQAGINKQRIYAYFKNKDGLFEAALSSSFERLLQYENVLMRLTTDQAHELTERIVRHYMTFHQQYPQFWRLLAWCNLEQIDLESGVSRIDGDVFKHLRIIYKEGQSQGIFLKDVSFETFIYMVTALSFFYFSNMKTMSRSLQLDFEQANVKEQIITEVLRQLEVQVPAI